MLWSYIKSSYTFCCTDCKKFKYFNFGHFLTVSFDLILLSCTHPLNNIWFGIYHLPESMWVQHKKLNREWGLDLTNSQFSSTSTSPFIFSFSLMCFSLYIKTLNFFEMSYTTVIFLWLYWWCLEKIKWFRYQFYIILTCLFCTSVSKALTGDSHLQSVCCIAFDQAVFKIERFYLDETMCVRSNTSLQSDSYRKWDNLCWSTLCRSQNENVTTSHTVANYLFLCVPLKPPWCSE